LHRRLKFKKNPDSLKVVLKKKTHNLQQSRLKLKKKEIFCMCFFICKHVLKLNYDFFLLFVHIINCPLHIIKCTF